MNKLAPKNRCNGCMACYNVCPKSAISAKEKKDGFLYPVINEQICINCGLCNRVCTYYHHEKIQQYMNPIALAAYSKNDKIRLESSSGGIFSEIATYVLDIGGYVAGAVCTHDNKVRHIITNNKTILSRLRGSKYVQSSINDLYKKIKRLLSENKTVLMCGTPCQIVGLYNYLGRNFDNLYTIDFICHGVNSPGVFKKYIQLLEKKYNTAVKKIKFRDKTYGWHLFSVKIWFHNNRIYTKDFKTDKFMKGFLKYHYYLRESCHDCQFRSLPRAADLTLGDFWGIENIMPDMDQNLGTSAVMINSEKGDKIFNKIKKNIVYKKSTFSNILKGNPALLKSSPKNDKAVFFINEFNKKDFKDIWHRYIPDNSIAKSIELSFQRNKARLLFIQDSMRVGNK